MKFGAYQFVKCRKCLAPTLVVDEYWPKTETVEEGEVISSAVNANGHCPDYVPERFTYPAFNKEPFPEWTHDLNEIDMILFWEIYSAIAMKLNALAMMGLRSVIDRYATPKTGDLRTFKLKLEALHDKKFINSTQFHQLQVVVEAGNAACHRGHRPTRDELMLCLKVVENIIAQERYGTEILKLKSSIPPRQN